MPIIWTLVARTGPVSILDNGVTVEGGLFMPFGVWVAPNGAVCNADEAQGVWHRLGLGLCETASFGSGTPVEDLESVIRTT